MKPLRVLCWLLLLAVTVPCTAVAQEIVWIRQFGTATSDAAHGISVDASGVYVAEQHSVPCLNKPARVVSTPLCGSTI